MSHQHRQDVTPRMGLLGLWSCVLLCSILYAVGSTAQTVPASSQTDSGTSPTQPQERFLQHFISQSLSKEATPSGGAPASPAPSTPAAVAVAPPTASALPAPPPQVDLTTTTLKMVLALAGMLGVLGGIAYGVRRYLHDQSPVGKRSALLRVLARVPLTPKASVALVEVPGKIVVIGITGTSLTALGEVVTPVVVPHAPPAGAETEALPTSPRRSFAATLDERSETLEAEAHNTEAFVRVSEAIQQKVSRLKQL